MPATPQTSVARIRTKLAAASLLVGTMLSVAVAMLGPVVEPDNFAMWGAGWFQSKAVSWLTTVYNDGYPDRDLAPADQIARTRQHPYTKYSLDYEYRLLASNPASPTGRCDIVESGYPWRSFSAWSISHVEHKITPQTFPPIRSGVFALTPDKSDPLAARWIPLNPLWPGLLANAAVWSLAVALPLFAWTEGRHAFRRRRNRCVNCGYSRAGLDAASLCPECGKA